MRKPEILAPAGNREMLESAVIYGADAVYLGIDGGLNLRAAARNFSPDDLCDAVTYAHAHGVRVYLTLNAFPHDHEFERLCLTIEAARAAKVDALIVADAGEDALPGARSAKGAGLFTVAIGPEAMAEDFAFCDLQAADYPDLRGQLGM